MEDNIGSTNMKGFVMSMQREGKLHNAILVEQVRDRFPESLRCVSGLCTDTYYIRTKLILQGKIRK